jgi:hypothetical protein
MKMLLKQIPFALPFYFPHGNPSNFEILFEHFQECVEWIFFFYKVSKEKKKKKTFLLLIYVTLFTK